MDAVAVARGLAPHLREAAPEADRLRRLPESVHRRILDAGLYHLYVPRRYGGRQADYWLGAEVAFELGRTCASAGWVASVIASHAWVQGMMALEAQDEVWKTTPGAVIASASWGPASTVTAEPGGFVVEGTWRFASGVDYADWVHLNLFMPSGHRFALVPRRDFSIVDDWQAGGLRGTGSNSVAVRNLFVPEYRTLTSSQCIGGETAGSRAHGGLLYRLPLYALFGLGLSAPAVGAARGAWDEIVEPLRAARRSASGAKLADQPTARLRIAEAAAEIDSAVALLQATCSEGQSYAAIPPAETRYRWRRNTAFAATLCVRAVERLYPLAGAGGLDGGSPFQRHFRDVHAIAAHIALAWDLQAANYGAVALGGPPPDPKI